MLRVKMRLRWKNINLPFGPVYKRNSCEERASFTSRKLNKPGIIVEMKKGRKQYLIGDINQYGGVCDDCMKFEPTSIVRRYAVIIE